MLFEDPTPLEQQADSGSTSTAELDNAEQSIDLVDAALRLALSNLPPKAFSGLKITEKASFKHLEDICPAMWRPSHLEVALIITTAARINTDNAVYRLLLQEQSFYLLSATPSLTQSHNERIHLH